ncbi:MAG: cobalt-precorrin-5B (C(1))-methyltransferase [Butyrivibrio sp.]|nr:cobalt-precorrin-5B (C(1))-methyltransferase [Butyrivibrio sp.]
MINHTSQMVRSINTPNYSSGICAAAAASAATKELLLSSSSKEVCIRSLSDNSISNINVIKSSDVMSMGVSVSYETAQMSGLPVILVTVSQIDIKDIPEEAVMDLHYVGLYMMPGVGIGMATVTTDGFYSNKPAISRESQELIMRAVADVCRAADTVPILLISISIKQGTYNKTMMDTKAGVVYGGSIWGSGYIVDLVSDIDIVENIFMDMKRQHALGVRNAILFPGFKNEKYLQNQFKIQVIEKINCNNYLGAALDLASYVGMESVLIAGNAGKLIRLASGVMVTSSRIADSKKEVIATHLALCGGQSSQLRAVLEANNINEILRLLTKWGLMKNVMASISGEVEKQLRERIDSNMKYAVVMFSDEYGVVLKTSLAEEIVMKVSREQFSLATKR